MAIYRHIWIKITELSLVAIMQVVLSVRHFREKSLLFDSDGISDLWATMLRYIVACSLCEPWSLEKCQSKCFMQNKNLLKLNQIK